MKPNKDIGKWKVLTSERIANALWFNVRKEKVQLPSGAIIPDYYVLDYPNWINVIGLTTEQEMVMIRQYRHGIEQVNYELAAGVCDPGETPLVSAKRELLEETGYGGGQWQLWATLSANPATHSNLSYSYLATDLVKIQEQKLEQTEDISVHLLKKEEVKLLLLNNQIPQALHSLSIFPQRTCRPTN